MGTLLRSLGRLADAQIQYRKGIEIRERQASDFTAVAASKLACEKPGQTLEATGLVHEARLKLANAPIDCNDKAHFIRTAATAMRQILVDRARSKVTAKRGGENYRIELQDLSSPLPDTELLSLDEALNQLVIIKPDHARVLELRYFAGMSNDEAAVAINVSPAPNRGLTWILSTLSSSRTLPKF